MFTWLLSEQMSTRNETAGSVKAATPKTEFNELLSLLGRLNYVWTNTESVLIHIIAGLARTDTDTATLIFLTLNTTRARLNLVERLAKLEREPASLRDEILGLTKRLAKALALKNRYNHCIYAFDTEDGSAQAILMRVQDTAKEIRYGKSQAVDADTIERTRRALDDLKDINAHLWAIIKARDFPC